MAIHDDNRPSKATQLFVTFLKQRGMRLTSERLSIVQAVSKQASLFSVDVLHTALEREDFHVSVATLYNTIELLLQAGVISCLRLPQSPTALYRVNVSESPHVFLVCRSCGAIKEVAAKPIARLIAGYSFSAFDQATFSLSVFGICRKCKKSKSK